MVSVVTDSAASLPRGLASELGVEVVPLYLRFGDEVLKDGVEVADFYERLERHKTASTSTPAPGDFLDAFRRAPGEEIVCITVSSAVSAIYRSALLAAEEADKRVEVVDSGNASMAEGFAVLEAARVARSGAALEEVVGRAKEVADRAALVATVPTFDYLKRSGRVNRLLAYAATKLHINPVFRFRRGVIEPAGRPRTRSRALDLVARSVLEDALGAPLHVAGVHAAAEAEARALVERVSAEAEVVESHIVEFTPAMGAHTGPGVVGLAFYRD